MMTWTHRQHQGWRPGRVGRGWARWRWRWVGGGGDRQSSPHSGMARGRLSGGLDLPINRILQDQAGQYSSSHFSTPGRCARKGRAMATGGHHRVHWVAMTAFWRTFHHDGKISPDWCVWGRTHSLPLSLYLPSQAKLWFTLQLSERIHSPYFFSTPICTLWKALHCIVLLPETHHKGQAMRHDYLPRLLDNGDKEVR